MDCGPASIKIIAKYFGKYYSLQYLRDLCGMTREGVSFLDLTYACEKIGLRTLASEATMEEIMNLVALPCIIHWDESHFIVVYKVSTKYVLVSDPAKGLLKYSIDQFKKGWCHREGGKGVFLAVEPQAHFKQIEAGEKTERLKKIENILGYFAPYKKSFINLCIVMLIVTLLQSLLPFISKAVIDVGIQTRDIQFIHLVLIGNIMIIFCVLLSNIVRDWILLHVTARVNIALISDYLIKLMRLPVSFFETKMTGDILQRAHDHERIRSFIMNNSLGMLFSILSFSVFAVIMFVYNRNIFYIFMAGSILYVIWIFVFLRTRKKLDWEYFDLLAKNQSYWIETIGGIQEIKVNNYEQQKRWKWEAIQIKLYKVTRKVQTISNIQNSGAQFINGIKNLSITFFCALAVIQGEITFGIMISTQFIIGMLNAPIQQLIGFVHAGQYAKISFARLSEIHQMEEEDEHSVVNSAGLPENKNIKFSGVVFSYSRNATPVLRGITLVIPEGKVTAIVGNSGSGKSTILKLLLRLYNPSVGDISVGGTRLNNINIRQWRSRCGIVFQDGKIFNDTVINNIVLGDEKIDFARLKKAVEIANIAWDIEQLPKGYDTLLGDSGRGISGGQKQRLMIARALYKNPDYLFLDEATNALDTINEQKIVHALEKAFAGKTVVVVAHRLSTIRKADQIAVMDNGFIVECGSHDVLMKRKGRYFKLVQSQLNLLTNAEVQPEEKTLPAHE
jgi:ATP-binding cassette subfamily B protein